MGSPLDLEGELNLMGSLWSLRGRGVTNLPIPGVGERGDFFWGLEVRLKPAKFFTEKVELSFANCHGFWKRNGNK